MGNLAEAVKARFCPGMVGRGRLTWGRASRRVAENPDIDHAAAARALVRAAIYAGLSEKEAVATVRSGLRPGGGHA
jgi:hypothetical protein